MNKKKKIMRKVIIINSKEQSQKVIPESNATTLGELKKEMRELGIDYKDCTFYEGHLRAELKDDNAVFPESVMWKGEPTTDLIFMLTKPNKKVESGVMSRKELISEAKRLGYPSNPTRAKSHILLEFIEKNSKGSKEEKVEAPTSSEEKVAEEEFDIVRAFHKLTSLLYSSGKINKREYESIYDGKFLSVGKEDNIDEISQSDIDEMFDFLQ